MSIEETNKRLDLLVEYMDIYIQLLPELGKRFCHKNELPPFEYYIETKDNPNYSLAVPHYKDSISIVRGVLTENYTKGLGSIDGVGYRMFNYWKGSKFYTGGNITGQYSIIPNAVNKALKEFIS